MILNIHLESLNKAISGLHTAFTWSEAAEGRNFWEQVMSKLEAYRDQATKNDECKEEISALKRRLEELEKRCCS